MVVLQWIWRPSWTGSCIFKLFNSLEVCIMTLRCWLLPVFELMVSSSALCDFLASSFETVWTANVSGLLAILLGFYSIAFVSRLVLDIVEDIDRLLTGHELAYRSVHILGSRLHICPSLCAPWSPCYCGPTDSWIILKDKSLSLYCEFHIYFLVWAIARNPWHQIAQSKFHWKALGFHFQWCAGL